MNLWWRVKEVDRYQFSQFSNYSSSNIIYFTNQNNFEHTFCPNLIFFSNEFLDQRQYSHHYLFYYYKIVNQHSDEAQNNYSVDEVKFQTNFLSIPIGLVWMRVLDDKYHSTCEKPQATKKVLLLIKNLSETTPWKSIYSNFLPITL